MDFPTKSEYIYRLLKKQITEGEIAQGETIKINEVAAANQVSAIPVREAFKRLEAEGLIDLSTHKSATVMVYNEEKIVEVMSIRALLEGYAAKCASEKMTPDQLRELRILNNQISEVVDAGDDEKFIQLNRKFHKVFYSHADMPTLVEMINNLWEGGNWSKALFAYFPGEMKNSVDQHSEILDAISNQEYDKIEQLMRAHKEGSIKLYLMINQMRM